MKKPKLLLFCVTFLTVILQGCDKINGGAYFGLDDP